jgi:hypothetical protein
MGITPDFPLNPNTNPNTNFKIILKSNVFSSSIRSKKLRKDSTLDLWVVRADFNHCIIVSCVFFK